VCARTTHAPRTLDRQLIKLLLRLCSPIAPVFSPKYTHDEMLQLVLKGLRQSARNGQVDKDVMFKPQNAEIVKDAKAYMAEAKQSLNQNQLYKNAARYDNTVL
jgi:hypothetical protein